MPYIHLLQKLENSNVILKNENYFPFVIFITQEVKR